MISIIKMLRDKGVVCGLATNQERYRIEYMKTEMGFSKLFDEVFNSAELGAAKPDPEFYQRITDRLEVTRDEILFWDDSMRNVQAAREFGWHAEHFRTYEAFKPMIVEYFPSYHEIVCRPTSTAHTTAVAANCIGAQIIEKTINHFSLGKC